VGCQSTAPLPVVQHLDLERYAGKWYEIARLPFSRQEGCVGTTAEYSLRQDGQIKVVNRCRDGAMTGAERVAEGKAWIVDKKTNAKLKVQFFWPFRGDYWVVELGRDYEYAVVGQPSRKYLWILSRSPRLEQETYEGILQRMAARGFDVSRMIRTPQA
jgi:apolipoprotein D and lipocalin family protein